MAANRERRANAGNRLQALLNQEEDMEELFDDEGVDEEFEIEGKEEDDIVDSDFDQSSADEEPVEDEEINLNEDPEDAKARRKQQAMLSHLKTGKSSFTVPSAGQSATTGRAKSARQAAAASVGITTKKKTISTTTTTTTTTSSRRVPSSSSTATTSAAASPGPSSAAMIKIPAEIRKSSRRTTVLNNQETELKLLEYETRKAMQPKREKVVVHKMTQEELLEEAKKTEEINLASLQAFKAMEMEKKKVVKKKEVAMGPFVRLELRHLEGPDPRRVRDQEQGAERDPEQEVLHQRLFLLSMVSLEPVVVFLLRVLHNLWLSLYCNNSNFNFSRVRCHDRCLCLGILARHLKRVDSSRLISTAWTADLSPERQPHL
ncbi:YL1-domain-containing protein [Linnemannia elongata AG-77]|uniref:YL1-domain-containing protein n=1 Tax=Linnemannia elongata AG-77 TaxID=1314771 RepID=A0A197JEQ4_9FUNG|nr:YL1-domain-containing protein [Linnemannia elongata AG-77]